MLNQDVHSVTPGGTWRGDMDENHEKKNGRERKQFSGSRNKGRGVGGGGWSWSYMEGRYGSEPRKSKREETSRDGLQTLRGLLPPFETDFIHPRELCIVQFLSKPPGFTDEANCLVF